MQIYCCFAHCRDCTRFDLRVGLSMFESIMEASMKQREGTYRHGIAVSGRARMHIRADSSNCSAEMHEFLQKHTLSRGQRVSQASVLLRVSRIHFAYPLILSKV